MKASQVLASLLIGGTLALGAWAEDNVPAPTSMPGPGMGAGMGNGARMGPGPRFGANNTAGWGMMTPEERNAHRQQMLSAKSLEECRAIQQQHHDQMAARAKERGMTMPASPRRDPCQWMQSRGYFK